MTALLLAGTGLGWATPALAEAPSDIGDAEIIVTATRRDASLQDVPISLQALGERTLDEQNVASFDDYVKLLPSVSFQSFGPGQSQLSFRGINSGGDGLDAGSLPTTGTYLDEIPITTVGATPDLHIYDIARVEALSGPQGTLFGASSLSGTLRIITNKPDPTKLEGGYDLAVTKFGKGDAGGSIEGFVNVPLAENAAIRLVGFYKKDGGYIDNTFAERTFTLDDGDPDTNLTVNNNALVEDDFNTSKSYGGRAALKIDLDDDWTLSPTFVYQRLETRGAFLYDPRVGDLEVHDFSPSYNKDRWWQAALTIEGKVGNWDVVYSGGYFKRRVQNEIDYSYYTVAYDTYGYYATYFPDGNGGFLNPTQRQKLDYNFTKHTQELRFSSPPEESLRLTAGAFFQRQTNDIDAQYQIPGIGAVPQSGLIWFQPVVGDTVYLKRLKRADHDYAMFGEANLDLTPTVTLTAGIRGFIAHNTLTGFSGFSYNITPACLPTDNPDIPCVNVYPEGATSAIPKKVDEAGETHKVNLTWKVTPDAMIYGTYSTGYRPGGVNRNPRYGPFSSDKLSNFEFGWKTTWLDGKLRWNGALFYQKWDDMQFALARPGDAGVTSIANVGGAKSMGVESDILLRLGGLQFSASASYIDAKLTEPFCEEDGSGAITCTPKGTRLPIQPKFKTNATLRYSFPLGSAEAFAQGGVQYQSGTRPFLLDQEVAVVGYTEGFTTADFSAGVNFDGFSIEAFIQNAFDERGQLSRNTACAPTYCGPYYRVYPVKPQYFGLKFGQRF
jgi:outer membrane receptor protein involved in Fe transport